MNVSRNFLLLAAVLGVIGMLYGIDMGIRENFAYAPVHAHINLVGWVSLAIFGLAYKAGLAKQDGWASIHFWIAAAGAIILPIGIYLSMANHMPLVVIIGSLLTLASVILFLINIWRAKAA